MSVRTFQEQGPSLRYVTTGRLYFTFGGAKRVAEWGGGSGGTDMGLTVACVACVAWVQH